MYIAVTAELYTSEVPLSFKPFYTHQNLGGYQNKNTTVSLFLVLIKKNGSGPARLAVSIVA